MKFGLADTAAAVAAAAAAQLVPFASQPVLCVLAVAAAYVLGGVVAGFALNYASQRRAFAILDKVPGPQSEGFFGATMIMARNSHRMVFWLMDMYKQHCPPGCPKTFKMVGPVCLPLFGGSPNEIHTADPRNVEHILKGNFNNYLKTSESGGFVLPLATDWLGTGIFVIDHGPASRYPTDKGKAWYTQRSTAARIFTRGNFKSFYREVFVEHGRQLNEHLEANAGKSIDIQQLMFAFTMDSFGKIAFGVDMGNLSGKDTAFGVAYDGAHLEVFNQFFKNIGCLLLLEAIPSPFNWLWEQLTSRLFCPHYKLFKEHMAVLHRYSLDVVTRRRKDPDLGKADDLLGSFMATADDSTGQPFTDQQLVDIVLNFIIAGRDTTACTLSWMWYELAKPQNAHVVASLHQEIDQVLQGDEPTWEVLEKEMPYLRGVVYEVLRLHPIVPTTTMHAVAEDTLPDGSRVPQNCRVTYDTYCMGHDPDRWGADVEELKPERWIPFRQPSQFEFPVFKGGPRLCLGMNMAIFEASLAAAMIMQKFTLSLDPGHEYTYSRMATSSVLDTTVGKAQLMMTVHRREGQRAGSHP